jgi:UDP-N-acetylmuramoyl-tripeptide--D-alanyl-D-alanine ligase
MNLFRDLCIVADAVASAVGMLRWLRVAQREHYLAGAVTRFARRWWLTDPRQAVLLAVALAALVLAHLWTWPSLFVAAVVVCAPIGLSLRGRTSVLRFTRRLRTVGGAAVALSAAILLAVLVTAGTRAALVCAGALGLAMPLVIDAALYVLAPLEAAIADRYVTSARRKLSEIRPLVVAITGSYGKTSTKGYLAHLLEGNRAVVASPASFNNQAGLARTVNEHLVLGTEVLIAEMGTYGKGEIAALCRWMPPEISIITAIGPVHLERFKSLDRTLEAKAEITTTARIVVLNIDDERLAALAQRLASSKRVLRCSATDCDADVTLIAREDETVELLVKGNSIGTAHIPIEIARTNLACAIAVALELGVSAASMIEKLQSLPIAAHRLNAVRSDAGVLVFDDTFNSNPAGTRLALDALSREVRDGQRVVVVTPGMVELGPLQDRENEEFARAIAPIATDVVVVARTNRRALIRGLRARTPGPRVVEVRTREEATSWVREQLRTGDVVLYENDLPDHFP